MVNINKTLSENDMGLLASLIGKKLEAIHHDEFQLGNLSIEKIGIYVDGKIYCLHTSYECLDFLWGEEGVASLHFVESNEDGIKVLAANPPIKYVKQTVNETITNILVIRDHIEEFDHENSMGTFTYDKAIVFAFNDHQIAIELDEWGSEMLLLTKSEDAVSRICPLSTNWGNDDMEEGFHFKATRTSISLKDNALKTLAKI